MSIGSLFTVFILPSIYMLLAPADKARSTN